MSGEEIFKALAHQTRRDIIRCLGEGEGLSFTEIKNGAKISDTPLLSYYLKTLRPLLRQEGEKYALSESGRDAYNLIIKSSLFPTEEEKRFRRHLPFLIVGNAMLWAGAIFFVDDALERGSSSLRIIEIMGGFSFASILLNSQLERHEGLSEKWERIKSFFKR